MAQSSPIVPSLELQLPLWDYDCLYPLSQVDMALSERPSELGHLTQALRTPCAFLQNG